jgi:hypothetical protein
MEAVRVQFVVRPHKTISVVLNRNDTVLEVRQSLEMLLGFPVNQLKCERRLLSDEETIGSFGLATDSVICVNLQVAIAGKAEPRRRSRSAGPGRRLRAGSAVSQAVRKISAPMKNSPCLSQSTNFLTAP